MKINICTVKKNHGECMEFSFLVPVQDVLPSGFTDDFLKQVEITGTVTNLGASLLVKGHLQAEMKDFCARCLDGLSRKIIVDFSEEYFLTSACDVEEFFKYEGDFLNIRELVVELLLAEKPMKSLCREDCQGLCPVCGINLNESQCFCDYHSIDPRLIKLKKYIN